MMKIVLLVLAVTSAYALRFPKGISGFSGVSGSCKTNADCGSAACCVPNSSRMVMTKRFAPMDISGGPSLFKSRFSGSTCVKYLTEGKSCHYLRFSSCGCAPDLKCKYYPLVKPKLPAVLKKEMVKKVGKRKMMYRPGKSICEKKA